MTDRCIFAGTMSPRVLPDRHLADCDECDCPGCSPCSERHCCVCGRAHTDHAHPLTCSGCVGDVREALGDIRTLWTELLGTAMLGSYSTPIAAKPLAAAPIPGGDALVMLSPHSDAHVDQLKRWTRSCTEHPIQCPHEAHEPIDETAQSHRQSLDLPDDPEPPLLTLATWEDAWRDWLEHGEGPRATIATVVAYLSENLTRMSQAIERAGAEDYHEFAPDFAEFAQDVRRIRSRLESVVHEGTRDDKAAAPCFDCGGTLVRRYTDDGRDDRYTCQRCRRVYDVASYWLAVRAHAESAEDGEAC